MHPIVIEAVAQAQRDDLFRAAEARRRPARLARPNGSRRARLAGVSGGLLRAVVARRSSAAGKSPVPCCV